MQSTVAQRAETIRDMRTLYNFLHLQHGAYAVGVSTTRLRGADRRIYDPKVS